MLTIHTIEAMLARGEHEGLIRRILENGRVPVRSVRGAPRGRPGMAHVLRDADVALAARGLAVQRICELTYGPTPIADTIAAELGRIIADRDRSSRNRSFWRLSTADLKQNRPSPQPSPTGRERSAMPRPGRESRSAALAEAHRGLAALIRHYEAVGRAVPQWLREADECAGGHVQADTPRKASRAA